MLKKIPLLGKKFRQNNDSELSENPSKQKELAKKLVYSLNRKKIPSPKQLKHFTKTLNKKEKKIVYGLSGLIVFCLLIIGGNFYSRNFITVPAPGGDYTSGLIGAPQFINPLLSQTNDVDSDISRLVFSGLLKYNKDLQLINDLASHWEANADLTKYTFYIKEGVTWHDGQKLTADDIVFTFQSIKDPDFKSPLLISLRGVEIKKIDDLTVEFTLPEAYPAFLEILTVGILPEHIWGEIPPGNANLTKFNLRPVGSGPWKFQKFFDDDLGNIKSFVIERYENYYGPKPYLDKITFKFYPDFQTAVAAFKNNSIEGISFLPKDLKPELAGEKNINFYSFYLPQYTAIFFNQEANASLKTKAVRQALKVSINKPEILTEALQLEGEIIGGPILPVDVTEDQQSSEYNPTLAAQLLEDAGWEAITKAEYEELLRIQEESLAAATSEVTEESEESSDGEASEVSALPPATTTPTAIETNDSSSQEIFRKNKDNEILAVTLTTVNQPENTKAAELIKQAWEKIGVKVDLQIVEGSRISREIIKPRNYQILLFGIIVGSNPDPYPFWHSSQVQDPGLNLSQLANREVDRLLENARKTLDQEEQRENYQRFQDILTSEIPAIFLYNPTYTYVVDKKIKGISVDRIITPADRFNNLEDWYVKTKKRFKANIN